MSEVVKLLLMSDRVLRSRTGAAQVNYADLSDEDIDASITSDVNTTNTAILSCPFAYSSPLFFKIFSFFLTPD